MGTHAVTEYAPLMASPARSMVTGSPKALEPKTGWVMPMSRACWMRIAPSVWRQATTNASELLAAAWVSWAVKSLVPLVKDSTWSTVPPMASIPAWKSRAWSEEAVSVSWMMVKLLAPTSSTAYFISAAQRLESQVRSWNIQSLASQVAWRVGLEPWVVVGILALSTEPAMAILSLELSDPMIAVMFLSAASFR